MTYNLELLLSLCSCLHSESQSAACSISEPSWNGGAAELSSTGLMQDQLLNCTKSQKVIFREQILNLWVLKLAERNSLYYTAAIFLSDMKRLFVPWQSFSRNKARRQRFAHVWRHYWFWFKQELHLLPSPHEEKNQERILLIKL